MNPKLAQEIIEKHRGTHKKTMSQFEIKVPNTTYETIKNNSIISYDSDHLSLSWCNFKGGEEKLAYEILKNNFELEVCDLINYKKFPAIIYMLGGCELNPGLLPSNRWRWLGIVSVGESKSIEWCWLHPFLRGAGVMKAFLLFYITEIRCLMVSPPVTNKMKHCLEAMNKYLRKDEILFQKAIEFIKSDLQEYLPDEDFSSYSNDETMRVFLGLQTLLIEEEFTKLPLEKQRKIVGMGLDMQKELLKNPELIEKLRNDTEFNKLINNSEKKREEIIKYGHAVSCGK